MKKYNLFYFLTILIILSFFNQAFASLTETRTKKKTQACQNKLNLKGEVINYGINLVTVASEIKEPNTASGILVELKSRDRFQKTSSVKMDDGVEMIVFYKIKNLPVNQTLNGFRTVTRHPPMKSPTGKIWESHESSFSVVSTDGSFQLEDSFVFFDKFPFEKVSGRWTFQVYYGKCLLAEQSFITTF